VKPYSSPRRSKIGFAVCCCFLGRDLSSKRMRSITAMNGSSFGWPAALCARNITRRRSELHHLGDRTRVDSKPSRRLATAQPLDLNRVANTTIKLHTLHPPPSNAKSYLLPDFCSGATGMSGRLNEGLYIIAPALSDSPEHPSEQGSLQASTALRLIGIDDIGVRIGLQLAIEIA
jgi:hypothetical protein